MLSSSGVKAMPFEAQEILFKVNMEPILKYRRTTTELCRKYRIQDKTAGSSKKCQDIFRSLCLKIRHDRGSNCILIITGNSNSFKVTG